MSSNTNILFWVITGAVIVLAVFLLVNTNVGNTITNIFDKFSSTFEDSTYIDTNEENDRKACKNYAITHDELFGTVNYLKVDESTGRTDIRYYFKNVSDKTISGTLYFRIYKCGSEEEVHIGYWILDNLQPNEEFSLFTNFDAIVEDYKFTFDFYIENKVVS